MRLLVSAGLALALAVALLLLVPESRLRRSSDLDLSRSGLPETFLMFSRTQQDRCRVVGRQDANLRRSDEREPGRSWDCVRIPGGVASGREDSWLVQSKRKGKGTVFFVPVYAVDDWTYPFLYDFVRQQREALELPRLEWTQLFVDRLYRGLYLRVDLPFDPGRKDGGSGVLRELLSIRRDRVSVLDTRFAEAGELFVTLAEAGTLPGAPPSPAELAWLAALAPAGATTFVLSNRWPHELSLLPLAISLPELYARKERRPLRVLGEAPYAQWAARVSQPRAPSVAPFDEAERALLEARFARYAASLHGALLADAELNGTLPLLRELLPERQAAAAELRLRLPEL